MVFFKSASRLEGYVQPDWGVLPESEYTATFGADIVSREKFQALIVLWK